MKTLFEDDDHPLPHFFDVIRKTLRVAMNSIAVGCIAVGVVDGMMTDLANPKRDVGMIALGGIAKAMDVYFLKEPWGHDS